MIGTLKKIMPIEFKGRLKTIKEKLYVKYLDIASSSNILANLHYVFAKDFEREHVGVLKGKLEYFLSNKESSANKYLLRRNIHRIEKGILMRPRRDIFAVNYILETVSVYKTMSKENIALDELKWAYDVLNEYFSIVKTHPIVDESKTIFYNIPKPKFEGKSKYIPYKREKNFDVNYEEFFQLSKYRRSVRWYKDSSISRAEIDKAIEIATLSPSACNRQPFEFRIFDDKELVSKMVKFPGGTAGYDHNIPVIVAVVGKLEAYFDERDRHLIYIDSSLAAMSFIYALEVQGISSCIINWPDVKMREEKMSDFLNTSPNERVIMLISLGYPDPEGLVAYSQKKVLSEIRKYNFE